MLDKFDLYEELVKKYRSDMENLDIYKMRDQIAELEQNCVKLDDFHQLQIAVNDLKNMVMQHDADIEKMKEQIRLM